MEVVRQGREQEDWEGLLAAARLAYHTPVREMPPLADRKASAILAANGLLISILLLFYQVLGSGLSGKSIWLLMTANTVAVLMTTLLFLGTGIAFTALMLSIPPMPPSLALFSDIAGYSLEDYRQKMREMTHRQALEGMLHYNYSLSVLSARKFMLVERAMTCLRWAFLLWLSLLPFIALYP